jgi:hypothetical protein
MSVRWLASFPKSGNTWARVFLANLFAHPMQRPLSLAQINAMPLCTDASPRETPGKEWIGKAHKAYSEETHGSRPAIYIVRDPVDIVPSAADFFGVTRDRMSKEVAKDWPRHVLSWWGHTGLILKYENMPDNFHTLAQLLDMRVSDFNNVVDAIQGSSFSRLQQDEQSNGFVEASEKGARFFRYGKPGNGREVLTDRQVARVVNGAGEVYGRLGYDKS